MQKKIILCLLLALSQASFVLAQKSPNRYESEWLTNPNAGKKDTRQVNAVIVFEQNSIKIFSRRKSEIFKEFQYKNIRSVEHSYSKNLLISNRTRATILMILTGLPAWNTGKERHWLTIVSEDDFVVLKIENDNYRLIKNEFAIRKLEIENINEDRQ
jgi:hypothetical protein